jgi:murein DD-endopeptidase MepM/ murein hydrolase activator NlpD
MKHFLVFLAGALLGSAALWFFVIGRQDTAPTVRIETAAPANLPVTRPAPKFGAPTARPAIRRDGPVDEPPPVKMIRAAAPGAEQMHESSSADMAAAPVDLGPATAVSPPESTPVAPVAAEGAVLSPPPPPLPPMRALALSIPVQGVVASQLLDTYDDARSGERVHEAIDIMAPDGTPVLAVEDGTIAKLFDSKQGGLTIYQFDATGQLAYYYAHLERYAPGIAEKQAVRRGDVIGYVGHTGNANPAGPHLHFAIFRLGPDKRWWKGTPVNPYPYLGGK